MNKKMGVPLPQGCTVSGSTVNFSVAVPPEEKCELLLYKKGKKVPAVVIPMEESAMAGTLRFIELSLENTEEYEYNYRIGDEIVPDPYGKAFAGRNIWGKKCYAEKHEIRTRIIRDEFPWDGDRPLYLPAQDVVAYSLHVRGFTRHSSSKVVHRGTFAGIMEKIPYILDLGVNQVQCMPVYEFEENLKYTNYWGYGEGFFFAPKSAYASEDAVCEMKLLVKTLHEAGIEIVLEMPFTEDTPQIMIIDCLRYWVMQYHIDGFIVNPLICDINALKKDAILGRTKISKKDDSFQRIMRCFLKGDEGMIPDVIWWLRHLEPEEERFNYIAGHNGFTLYDVVSYDGKHNEANGENNQDGPVYNYSWNCGAEGPSRKKTVTELRKKQIFNAFFLLLLAQGAPCILAGDEFANTQKGNNNVYCQDNATAWLEWNKLEKEKDLHTFVKKLIAFRRKHKLFHPDREMRGFDETSCGIPDVSYHGENAWQIPSEVSSRQLGVFYHNSAEENENCYVAYNMHWLPHTFALPTLPKGQKWYEAANTEEGILEKIRPLNKARDILLKERTIKVFVGKQEKL